MMRPRTSLLLDVIFLYYLMVSIYKYVSSSCQPTNVILIWNLKQNNKVYALQQRSMLPARVNVWMKRKERTMSLVVVPHHHHLILPTRIQNENAITNVTIILFAQHQVKRAWIYTILYMVETMKALFIIRPIDIWTGHTCGADTFHSRFFRFYVWKIDIWCAPIHLIFRQNIWYMKKLMFSMGVCDRFYLLQRILVFLYFAMKSTIDG